jgi:hypothetical protein
LEFLGFSNPRVWDLERLIGKAPDLMQRAAHLSEWERYRLIELLDPESITHYEFFLGRPPIEKSDWSSDAALLAAIPERNPCMDGWDSRTLFNFDYQIVTLTDDQWAFLKAADGNVQQTVGQILESVPGGLEMVRSLLQQQLLMLTPGS